MLEIYNQKIKDYRQTDGAYDDALKSKQEADLRLQEVMTKKFETENELRTLSKLLEDNNIKHDKFETNEELAGRLSREAEEKKIKEAQEVLVKDETSVVEDTTKNN